MNFSPVLKYVSIKVDDLEYTVKYFKNLFDFHSDNFLDITSNENANKNETYETTELFSDEGGASLQFVKLDSNNYINPIPNLLQTGIIGVKIKTRKLHKSYASYRDKNIRGISNILVKPLYHKHFHIIAQDLLFQIVEDDSNFFGQFEKKNGGVKGLIIGVLDIEKSVDFYKKVLGYDKIIYQGETKFEDFEGIEGSNSVFQRVILEQSTLCDNKFLNYFGSNQIELIKVIDNEHINYDHPNIINPYRFGFYSTDNRDIIGNYIDLGYSFDSVGNDKYIEIKDPNGILITCHESTTTKKPNFIDDIKIFSKLFKQKL